jgi:hypothetical protein
MTMTYADAQALFFTELVGFARVLLNPDATEQAIDEVLTGLAAYGSSPGQVLANLIEGTAVAHRGEYPARKALARAVLALGMANMLTAIGSRYVDGGQLTDPVGGFFDLREQMDADGDYITDRGNSPAADPAPGSGILVERLTVDHLGQEIGGGIHSETVTGEVILNTLVGAGQGRAQMLLTGEAGPEDELDYRHKGTAQNANVTLDFVGDTNPGDVPNSVFAVSGNPSHGATVSSTNLASWTQSDLTGTPITTFTTTSPWRNRPGGINISGNGTAKRYQQTLILGNGANPYRPISLLATIRPSGTFTGAVAITVGSVTRTFVHGDLTLSAFNYLRLLLNENRYPVNFDNGASVIRIDITITTGSVDLFYFDAQNMTARQGYWYAAWNHTADPVAQATVTWADTCSYDGVTADVLAVAWDQAPFAYLPTSGSNLIADAQFDGDLEVSHGGTVVNDGGNVALGTTSGVQTEIFRLRNRGAGLMAVAPGALSGATNCTAILTGFTAPIAMQPGDYVDVELEITPSGAGAYDVDVSFDNSDPTEHPYNFNVAGTSV